MPTDPDAPYCIYGLDEPDGGHLRWIGVTQNPTIRRLGLLNGSNANVDTPVWAWIHSLRANGKKPVFHVLAEISGPSSREVAFIAEAGLIRRYSRHHFLNLLNVACNPFRKVPRGTRVKSL